MQNIIFYVAANETLAAVRDYANAKNATAPTLVRGAACCLKMRLFANSDGTEPYPMEDLSSVVSWSWAMDSDFDAATAYKLVGDNEKITLASIEGEIDGEVLSYTEISIPMTHMNTAELAEWLGTRESQNTLAGELCGYDASGELIFILQVKSFTIRNRITSLSDPLDLATEYLTEAQVRALIAAGLECQFSVSGDEWHDKQSASDLFLRLRSRGNDAGVWSDPIQLLTGPKGDPGKDSFCYVAYASDAAGTGFSLTPSNALKFRVEIHVAEEIPEPGAEDFGNAVWVKYLGDDGQGVGDMVKTVYDTDDDGKVNASQEADHSAKADSVPWSGITDKPSTYTPAAHEHTMSGISDPVFQKVYLVANPKTLYLDSPIVKNTSVNGSGTIELEFTAIQTKVGGSAYSIGMNEMLTWEYHVPCSVRVTGVSLGSLNCSMVGIHIPETLELSNNNRTYHVFVIRALRKDGAINNVCFQANYAYSYEG